MPQFLGQFNKLDGLLNKIILVNSFVKELTIALLIFFVIHTATAKPTHTAPESASLRLKIKLESGSPNVESGIILNPDVLDCLRQFVDPHSNDFTIELAGRINEEGAISAPTVSRHGKLGVCLMKVLKQVSVSNLSPGPFRVRIFRSDVETSGAKSFRLDSTPAHKKFE